MRRGILFGGAAAAATLVLACSSSALDEDDLAAAASTDGEKAAAGETAAAGKAADPERAMPSLDFTTVDLPDVDDAVACSGAVNTSVALGKVYFAQTHLMEPSWPFFALAAERPTLIKVDATGSGPSPEVKVVARRGGAPVGALCLKGPALLPGKVADATQSLSNSFHATLPAAWMAPGTEIAVSAGGTTRTFSASTLAIGAAPIFTLVTVDALLFGDRETSPRGALAEEIAGRLPIARMHHAPFPAPLVLPRVVVGPRDDGNDGRGTTVRQPALWADRRPSCTAAERTAGTCTKFGGYGVLQALRQVGESIQRANGLATSALFYVGVGEPTRLGGGLAGGIVGAGDDYKGTFNHEIGHSFGMPHWGGVTGSRSTNPANVFPYGGDYTDADGTASGGGFGRTFAYDPADGTLVAPVCADTGKEMQDPMQRRGACPKPGRVYDFYSDFSSLRILRYFTGAAAYAGRVSYRGADVPFAFPEVRGREELVDPAAAKPSFRKWNLTTRAYDPAPSDADGTFGSEHPTGKGPVYLVHGTFNYTSDATSSVYEPILYRGFTMPSVDLTRASDFAALKAHGAGASGGADLTVRAEYADGTVRHFLLRVGVRGDGREDPLSNDGFKAWAVNVPADKQLAKVTLLYRPIAVRAASDDLEGNLAAHPEITPDNVYADARVAASWSSK